MPPAPAAATCFEPMAGDAADGQHRHGDGRHHGAKAVEAEQGLLRALGFRRKHRAGDDVVRTRRLRRLSGPVDRAADEEPVRRQAPCRLDGDRIGAQVDAIGRARERDVEAIVDDHAGRSASRHGDKIRDERRQLRSLEIALTHLDEVDAGVHGMARLRDQAAPRHVERRIRGRKPAAIGDEAERHRSVSLASGLRPAAAVLA